ncbi:MAG TPA: LysM peptidoglycan-binding domain-containing protein [Myxococcota bacterium]|nr:LysM peptidoglycan-binding domain-containing protein [Myxococcota bacterium]
MQSWILAFSLVVAAGGAWAEEAVSIQVPDAVPPIPSPWEPMEARAPIDGPWPAAPADSTSTVDEQGAPVAVPAIPAPKLSMDEPSHASNASAPDASDASNAETAVATPKPAKVRPPFDPAGTIHVVQKGDTLWDISDLYLGTPWIWPSVWRDNQEIENPHLILPGDKIWVSATEMRKVSDEEAAALLAARDAAGDEDEPMPAAMAEDVPSVPMPQAPAEYFRYPELPTVGVVSKKALKGIAEIVGTTEEQVFLAQGDVVFIDLGEQDTSVGDEFVIFKTGEKVHDPATRRVIGRHTQILGWLEVTEVYGESARAKIRMSYGDLTPGAYLMPREIPKAEIEIKGSPVGVEGQLADLLTHPKYNAGGDVVVLNRGSEDGLEEGSTLELYRPVSEGWKDHWYGRQPDIEIPHDVVAQMIVLTTQPHTAMAYVRRSTTELAYGDRFRTVGGPSVEWPEGGLFILPRIKGLVAGVPRPDLDTSDWNLPRLALPGLDGYDPR